MKLVVFLFGLFILQLQYCCLRAQSKPVDTSFTTYSAFNKIAKAYPQASLIIDTFLQDILRETNIVYKPSAQRALYLDLFKPLENHFNHHVPIIILHGGGWRSGNRQQHHPLAAKLASLGYTCFTPEYRLSAEALFPAAVEDIFEAIRWVKLHAKAYQVDSNKLVVLGFSAGGELAAFTGVTANRSISLFKENGNKNVTIGAMVDIDGTLSFVHPESTEGNDKKDLSAATRWIGCSRDSCFEKWKLASPLYYVDGQTPPTLFLNSSVAGMHAGRTDFIDKLQQHHIYSEVHEWPDAPHSFCLFEPWFTPTVNKIDLFLRKVLHL